MIRVIDIGKPVLIDNVAPCWNGKVGRLIRWVHDQWYIVIVGNPRGTHTELMLDASRSEFMVMPEEG